MFFKSQKKHQSGHTTLQALSQDRYCVMTRAGILFTKITEQLSNMFQASVATERSSAIKLSVQCSPQLYFSTVKVSTNRSDTGLTKHYYDKTVKGAVGANLSLQLYSVVVYTLAS